MAPQGEKLVQGTTNKAPEAPAQQIAPQLDKLARKVGSKNAELSQRIRDIAGARATESAENQIEALRANLTTEEKETLSQVPAEQLQDVTTRSTIEKITTESSSATTPETAEEKKTRKKDEKARKVLEKSMLAAAKAEGGELDFGEKIMIKLMAFAGPILHKMGLADMLADWGILPAGFAEGMDILEGRKTAKTMDGVKGAFADKKEAIAEKIHDKKYKEKADTLAWYMDNMGNSKERTIALNILKSDVFAQKNIAELQKVHKEGKYENLAKEIGEPATKEVVAKVLSSLFPPSTPKVGENYAGYLFQKSLKETPNSVTFYDVITSMGGLMAAGARIASGFFDKLKSGGIPSKEEVSQLFQDTFTADEKGVFSNSAIHKKFEKLGISNEVFKEIKGDPSILLSNAQPTGFSEGTRKFMQDTLIPFVNNFDVKSFCALHKDIDEAGLRRALRNGSAENILQLYIITGAETDFAKLGEDEQGLVYVKLLDVASNDKELQASLLKIVTTEWGMNTYISKLSSTSNIPESFRRFLSANFQKTKDTIVEWMSDSFKLAWEATSFETKAKMGIFIGLVSFILWRLRPIMSVLKFSIIAGLLYQLIPEAKAFVPHEKELGKKLGFPE